MKIWILVVLAVSSVAAALEHENPGRNAITSRPNYDDVDYYNCEGKRDCNHPHPHDCTRYIQCHNGRASDIACPDCDDQDAGNCQGNPYLVYRRDRDWCDWPSHTTCHTSTTHSNPTTTTTPATTQSTISPDPMRVAPECGLEEWDVCIYGQAPDDKCSERYWFQKEIESTPEPRECEGADDIWDAATEICAPCHEVAACLGGNYARCGETLV